MSKAAIPGGSGTTGDENADDEPGLEHVPIRKQEDGSYHVGDRGGPLGEGETETEAFLSYALRVREALEGEDVPISTMAYHGTLKRPVNYIMLDSEVRPDGAWHMTEVGGRVIGRGATKTEARIHLATVACDLWRDD